MSFVWTNEAETRFMRRTTLLSREAYLTASLLGVLLFPVFAILDYFIHREAFSLLNVPRFIAIGLFLFAFMGARKKIYPAGEFISGMLLLAISSACITAMCVILGGYSSPYYAGINLVIFAGAFLFPWSFFRMTIAIGTVIGIWLLGVLIACRFHIDAPGPFANNMAFLLATGTVGVSVAHFGGKLRRDSFAWTETERTLTLQDEFISVASHELRTPLTSLLMQAQLMMRRPETAAKGVQKFERQLRRLSTLVDQMLDLSRLQAGKLTLSRTEADFSKLIDDACEALAGELTEKGIKLEKNISGQGHGLWDSIRIEQVITNLLTNAIKYGRGKPISISFEEREGMAVLKVKDQGIGIAPENFGKVFSRFERVACDSSIGGLGLGLYIANQIAAAHNGSIQLESELGQGSTFTLVLPLFF